MSNKIMTEILDQINAEGYQEGTPQFEFMLRKRKVERCRELHGLHQSCSPCPAYDSCELIKAHLRDMAEVQHAKRMAKMERERRKEAELEAEAHRASVDGIEGSVPITAHDPDAMAQERPDVPDQLPTIPDDPDPEGES